jgi:hypothetical protein
MTGFGPFNTPILNVQQALGDEQRARAAALLVGRQARPGAPVEELLSLASYVYEGAFPRALLRHPSVDRSGMIDDNPGPVAMNFGDPSIFTAYRHPERHNIPDGECSACDARAHATFGDLADEDDGLG